MPINPILNEMTEAVLHDVSEDMGLKPRSLKPIETDKTGNVPHGGFLQSGYPQIILFNGVFKPTIINGYPYGYGNPPLFISENSKNIRRRSADRCWLMGESALTLPSACV